VRAADRRDMRLCLDQPMSANPATDSEAVVHALLNVALEGRSDRGRQRRASVAKGTCSGLVDTRVDRGPDLAIATSLVS
jgi:hypothetical protein